MRRAAVFAVAILVAPVFGGGPADAVSAAAADLARLADHDREFARYLWHPSPILTAPGAVGAVAGLAADLGDFDPVLRFHANQLSRAGALEPPARVAFGLWRVDLRHYKWDRAVWEKMAEKNVYFNETLLKVTRTIRGKQPAKVAAKKQPAQKGASKKKVATAKAGPVRKVTRTVKITGPASWLPTEPIAYLIEQTESRTPIVHAGWFLANTCRQLTLSNEQLGYGYYDWLGVKNRDDFFKIADVRLEETRKRELDSLEAVDKSGVSKQNRQIDSEPTIHGRLFITLDTQDESGRGNAIQNLRRGDFVHQAEEHYLPLATGLPAYLLCDAQGVLQASAPDFIGPDNSPLNASTDGRIHVGIACIRCHAGQVLQPVDGWARREFRIDRLALNVQAKFKRLSRAEQIKVFEELKRQYLRRNFTNEINEQRTSYRRAIQEACGLDAGTLARRFARAYHAQADDLVFLEEAARTWGFTPEQVRTAFVAHGGLEAVQKGTGPGGISAQLGALVLIPSRPMKRLHFEDHFAEGARIMMAYKPEENKP